MKWLPEVIKQLKDCPNRWLRAWIIAWMFFQSAMKVMGPIIGGIVIWYIHAKLHLK